MSSSIASNSDEHISLWYTPQNHLIQKMSRGAYSDKWNFAGLLRQGETHRVERTACDDYAKAVELGDGTFVAVVCDGAGSAAKGGIGSRVCAEKFIDYVTLRCDGEALTVEDIKQGFCHARAGLETEAVKHQLPIEAFASTMVTVTCLAESTIFAQIGDGFAVANFADGRLEMPLIPDRGEFANQTYFLTSQNWIETLQVATITEPCMGCTLSTDGLQNILITRDQRPYEPFFTKMFGHTKNLQSTQIETSLRDFLSSNLVNSKVSDDATIIIAVKRQTEHSVDSNHEDTE